MATLAEIRTNPAAYLGEGGEPEDYDLFVRAVEVLTGTGTPEDEAIALVWGEGDWYPRAAAVLAGVRAVEALVSAGVPEDEAIAKVWSSADWYPRVLDALRAGRN